MSYTPSEAFVEVLALSAWEAARPGTISWADCCRIATAQAVAFMGETVTEPCARCGGTGEGTSWIDHGASMGAGAPIRRTDPCLACNGTGKTSPRSLAVVECEAAGLLQRGVEPRVPLSETSPALIEDLTRLFGEYGPAGVAETVDQMRAAAPSTGSPT